jgi:hypothetical protein
MAAREGVFLHVAGTSPTLWNDITTRVKQSPMAMLPHTGARIARLQPSILVGVLLRTNRGIQCTYQCYVPVNANVYISSSAQAAIMESACAIFELEKFSLCTLRSVVGVVQVYLQPIFTSALGVSEWSASRLTREERNFCSELIRGLVSASPTVISPLSREKLLLPFWWLFLLT